MLLQVEPLGLFGPRAGAISLEHGVLRSKQLIYFVGCSSLARIEECAPVASARSESPDLMPVGGRPQSFTLPPRRGSPGSAFPICRRPRQKIWRFALPARPSSADRTQSPADVSQKREFSKCPPETTGYFGQKMPQIGTWRPVPNSQKPAIGGPFREYRGQFLWPPDWLADLGG